MDSVTHSDTNNSPAISDPKHEKFKEIASKRTTSLAKQIRLLGNLSSKKNYNYTDEEVEKMFAHLAAELKKAKSKFKDKDDCDFSF